MYGGNLVEKNYINIIFVYRIINEQNKILFMRRSIRWHIVLMINLSLVSLEHWLDKKLTILDE